MMESAASRVKWSASWGARLGRRPGDQQLELVGLSQCGLARAFATDADILLMDEPFSALDPLILRKLQDELLTLQERVRKTINPRTAIKGAAVAPTAP